MKLTKEQMIEAGGKVWEKENMMRIYMNNKEVIAKIFNYAIVESLSGSIPAGFDGMLKTGKTKSYYDCVNNVFYADSGDIANAARANDLDVRRI